MDKEKMIKAARVIKTGCGSLENDNCFNMKVECPFQEIKDNKYLCLLKSFSQTPCNWKIPLILDEWISRFDNGFADELSQSEQIEIKEMLIELKIRREKESNE